MSQKTALYEEHKKLNARIVDFAGWQLPVQYVGLRQEHLGCRNHVGLFDVSHMGEIRVRGHGATEYLNSIVTNDVSKMKHNQAQYTVMCYEHGGCVDDLIVHKIADDDYFICVNAANADKDFSWFAEHKSNNVSIENESSQWTQIALQGRHAETILQKAVDFPLKNIAYYHFQKLTFLGQPSILARTGYTGEDGFEIYVPWNAGPTAWQFILHEGAPFNITPCGLGARDTLRLEMKFPLYGHEIDENLNPLEAGLGWVVKLEKENFIGKKALLALKESGLQKKLIGLKSLSRSIPRQGYLLEHDGKTVGQVCSGTMSPSLDQGIAVAYIERKLGSMGSHIDVLIRNQKVAHEVVQTPFYKRPY